MVSKKLRIKSYFGAQSAFVQPAFFRRGYHSLSNSFSWWQWNKRSRIRSPQPEQLFVAPVDHGKSMELLQVSFIDSIKPADSLTEKSPDRPPLRLNLLD